MQRPTSSTSGAGGVAGRRVTRWVWVAWSVTVAATLLSFVLWIVQVVRGISGPIVSGIFVDGAVDALIVVAYVATGVTMATIAAVLVSRVPSNPIGWILGAVAVWHAATFLVAMSLHVVHVPGPSEATFANWLGAWTFVVPGSATLVLILFPTGTLVSRRWRVIGWLAVLGPMVWAVIEATSESLGGEASMPNPFANAGVNTVANVIAGLVLLPALIGTIASLVIRYRRSAQDVRMQIKWVASGGLVAILVWLGVWVWSIVRPETFGATAVAIGTIAMLITPVALAVAILKYRLYDIERLVSRTVSYALLAAVLAGGYVIGVIGIQTLFPASGSLAVAATTLAVAAVFNPLRRRLHDLMDRRFNRRHFDAALVLSAFDNRIDTVSSTEELAARLTTLLEKTLAPSSVSLWIRK